MANPLYNQYSNNSNNNGISNIIEQAKELKKNLNGNPQQIVQNLLNSGQMSQKTFNELSQIAQQVVRAMGEDI